MTLKDGKTLHIAMFPWLAFGHIIPYLDLAKLIARKGHRISFVSTPRNIDRLPKLPSHLASSNSLVKIPLPKLPELPENAEATMDLLEGAQMDYLKKGFDGLESGLTRFLEDSKPDWIISVSLRIGCLRSPPASGFPGILVYHKHLVSYIYGDDGYVESSLHLSTSRQI